MSRVRALRWWALNELFHRNQSALLAHSTLRNTTNTTYGSRPRLDNWIAIPQPQASTSSFGAGTEEFAHRQQRTVWCIRVLFRRRGQHLSSAQHLQAPAVGAGLSPYLTAPNAFAKLQQQ
ncbi:hypothetical protein FRC04_005974 [Tulasnella sp. 424]|nr:hypothetical protein FRC04_005974 [Tulasnella sp. 424]